MHRHRFLEQIGVGPPQAVEPITSASAFVVCPMVLPQGGLVPPCFWRPIYQLAYEQACAVVRPSRLERLQAVSLN